MNKKLIFGITILTIVVLAFSIWLYTERWIEPPLVPPPTTEPASGNLSTLNHVSDDKLGYGFEYPEGWGAFVNVDKDVEQCDPILNYETYTCVDFPDKNIKKVVSLKKEIYKEGAQVSADIEFMVKSATDLQDVANEFKKEITASGMPILNETKVSINNISGYNILAGTPDWKLRQVVFFANGTAYILKYSSQEEFYRLHEDTFNNIINSFNIKNEKQNETNANKPSTDKPENAQIANPASVNCIEKGGKLSIVDKPEGQVGMCTLSDGTVCEEWAYFRGECTKG